MAILKEFAPRKSDLKNLRELLTLKNITDEQKKKIELEIYKLQLGEQAEKNASFYLQKRFRDRKDWILINGLRLELENDVAQIDHLGISKLGIVYLFETKNFSTGIKVTDRGEFFRWDNKYRKYVEIPSPIQQSLFHEVTLQRAFKQIGFEPKLIAHFVLVDYNAKLIKPKKGFENVCRPDRIDEAIENHQDLGFLGLSKILLKLAKDTISDKHFSNLNLRLLGQKLIQMDQPIEFNYYKKFGINSNEQNIHITPSEIDVKEKLIDHKNNTNNSQDNFSKLTFSKFAQQVGLDKTELENQLVKSGVFERIDDLLYLTPKGKEAQIEFRKGRFGPYFLIPKDYKL